MNTALKLAAFGAVGPVGPAVGRALSGIQQVHGEESELTLSVSRNGRPVTDVQPHLGGAGAEIRLATTAPTPGSHRTFLDVQHGDVVRTASTLEVAA